MLDEKYREKKEMWTLIFIVQFLADPTNLDDARPLNIERSLLKKEEMTKIFFYCSSLKKISNF